MHMHQGITVQCYIKGSNLSFNFYVSFWENMVQSLMTVSL